ncbi:MAG: acetoin utilization protein AcuC [Pseudomonadota bacterium]
MDINSDQSPWLIGSEIYRRSTYGSKHPLAIPRVSTALDLIRAMGWLDETRYIDSPMATPAQLGRFHDPDYVAALQEAERAQGLPADWSERYGLGRNGNPFFTEMFRRPATACGASILAAELLADGGIVHSPAGGTHHGRRDRASGFCYLNDPALAILGLLDRFIAPVAYIDIDAHHGDGVQDAFDGDDRVWTISVHEGGRWPFTGPTSDRGGGQARNLAVPEGLNDSEFALILARAIVPLVERIAPAAIVLQCGADGVEEDPLAKLSLSNRSHIAAVRALMPLAPRLLVLGGGGYNPWSVGRCWASVWAVLNDLDPEQPITPAAESVLRGLTWRRTQGRNPPEHWFTTLADRPRTGPIRPAIRDLIAAVLAP